MEHYAAEADSIKDLKKFRDKVTRHEIIHAFLEESGLADNSEWARNEEMIDWFAIQLPKIANVCEKLKII